ncbi:MAG: hypothetical protein LUH41_01720 [Clostridiales bacterium]|nr:hypothetical protein [Clostridiales bacterium]
MSILKKKSFGWYVLLVSAIVAVVGLVQFSSWAPNHSATDSVITVALILGIAIDLVTIWKDLDILVVASTACYMVGCARIVTDNVGSFVDAYQGIVMFGDSTQVGTIISIAVVMGVAAVLSAVSGFLPREKA